MIFDNTDFIKKDHRKNRSILPLNQEYLEEKYGMLLPESFVKGKKILDLGSCLGAAGYWVLKHGAREYVGVEVQKGFVKLSKALLPEAIIIESNVINFLPNSPKFDIILALGVLYDFSNPTDILRSLFNLCNTLIIESMTPLSIFRKKIPELPIVEYYRNNAINSDKGEFVIKGFSGFPSVSYTEMVAEISGFSNVSLPFTGINWDSSISKDKNPLRYIARYDKTGERKQTLEELVNDPESKLIPYSKNPRDWSIE